MEPRSLEKCTCVSECVRQKHMCACECVCRMPAKLKPPSRWTVWINKCCAWHDCSLCLFLSLLPSVRGYMKASHELIPCFQKPFVWLGSRTDSIMSEGQEVKKPRVASCFSLCAMPRMDTRIGEKKKTFKPEEIILQVNIASFFWGCMHAVRVLTRSDWIHTTVLKCSHSIGKK